MWVVERLVLAESGEVPGDELRYYYCTGMRSGYWTPSRYMHTDLNNTHA